MMYIDHTNRRKINDIVMRIRPLDEIRLCPKGYELLNYTTFDTIIIDIILGYSDETYNAKLSVIMDISYVIINITIPNICNLCVEYYYTTQNIIININNIVTQLFQHSAYYNNEFIDDMVKQVALYPKYNIALGNDVSRYPIQYFFNAYMKKYHKHDNYFNITNYDRCDIHNIYTHVFVDYDNPPDYSPRHHAFCALDHKVLTNIIMITHSIIQEVKKLIYP